MRRGHFQVYLYSYTVNFLFFLRGPICKVVSLPPIWIVFQVPVGIEVPVV